MRKLIYVPVIHVASDLGSIAPEIEKRSAEVCGQRRWERHKWTVDAFWDVIGGYFAGLDAGQLKIYQDGLMAGGELGHKIIEEGAKRGSRNHQIVLDLIKRGAEIRKTEDVELLKEEFSQILTMVQTGSTWERTVAQMGHAYDRQNLLERRDGFIARTINQTLTHGETAILFIGAFHDVLTHLSNEIIVEEVKSGKRVRDYFRVLISGRDDKKFKELAMYLMSEVRSPMSEVRCPKSEVRCPKSDVGCPKSDVGCPKSEV